MALPLLDTMPTLRAAVAVLNEVLSLEKRAETVVTKWSTDIRGCGGKGLEKSYQARELADKVRVDLAPNNGALDSRELVVKTAGEYRVCIKASGAACHLKIDPLGLAFKNFDAIRRWRTEEIQKDGRKFRDANGLKRIHVSMMLINSLRHAPKSWRLMRCTAHQNRRQQ